MENLRYRILERGGYARFNPMQEAMFVTRQNKIALLSPTGSGKTAAFVIGLARHLTPGTDRRPQAVIIVPSRELALQVADVIKKLCLEFRVMAFYGGHQLREELNSLKGGSPDIIVATPGRLLDHLDRDSFPTGGVDGLIIDEFDKCLELGFQGELKRILKRLPKPRFFMMTSATYPDDDSVLEIVGKPHILDFRNEEKSAKPDITVIEVPASATDKLETLERLLANLGEGTKSIVFVNHRESAERVFDFLKKKGFPVALYHGAIDQIDRELAVITLRNGTTPVMVATDLAGRGLDIPDVDAVIHYHLPTSKDVYVHRNGRTARANAKGDAYVIINEHDDIPDYISFDREWNPSTQNSVPVAVNATLVFNLGRKDKISRADILGFLVKQGQLPASSVGKIDVADRYVAVSFPAVMAGETVERIKGQKIKGKKFLSRLINATGKQKK